jgi:hypothetical protein
MSIETDQEHDPPPGESAEGGTAGKKPKWGKTMKVSLGLLGGLGLLMGYVSAAGMQQSELEAGARKAIDDFISALNARDLEAARSVLNYPHIHFAGHEMTIWLAPEEFHIDFDALAQTEGWHRVTLDYCAVRQSCADKIHFEVQYSRHRIDSVRYAVHPSIWVVTLMNGRWGIQCRSILSGNQPPVGYSGSGFV